MTDLDGITVVTEPSEESLNERQLSDYRSQREDCLKWLLTFGKNPDMVEGYAFETVHARAYRMDMFYRWVWEQEGRYVADVTHEHADAWMQELAYQEKSNAHKDNCQKAVQMLLKWRHHKHGLDEWEPDIRFNSGGSSQPRDFLTRAERSKIREAALEYGSIPSYNSLSPEERDRWRIYLAQRFEKPKSEVTPDDWDRANGWKIPSLVFASLDAGLRPIEVARATPSWVDVENNVLRIVSTLLMGVYPDDYVNFQYERFETFFSDCGNIASLETGFDARQYYRIVLACRDLRDVMQEELPDASMLDVHTLIRLYQDFGENSQ
jgi:hypothetical protein